MDSMPSYVWIVASYNLDEIYLALACSIGADNQHTHALEYIRSHIRKMINIYSI